MVAPWEEGIEKQANPEKWGGPGGKDSDQGLNSMVGD